MFGKYNGFVSNARVSACMYFLVIIVSIYSRKHQNCAEKIFFVYSKDSSLVWKFHGKITLPGIPQPECPLPRKFLG
jgi:hypothetical protein